MLTALFWTLLALDLLALGVMTLLALAAAGPSRTSPLAVLGFMASLALPLLLAAGLWLRFRSPGWRTAALLLVAAPGLLLLAGRAWSDWTLRGYTDASGKMRWFRDPAGQDLEAAIERGDAAKVKQAAPQALPAAAAGGRAGMTPLLLALRQLERQPPGADPAVLRELLAAGADPNAPGQQLPLEAAIAASRRLGLLPVKLLLEAGAQPDRRNEFGTPAWFLGAAASIDPAVLELLLAHGADLQARDGRGGNAVVTAVLTRNWPAARLLVERGAEWRAMKMPNGRPLLEAVDADARLLGPASGAEDLRRWLASH